MASDQPILMSKDGVLEEAVKLTIDHPDLPFIANYMTARLTMAAYYRAVGEVVPLGSVLSAKWQTNANLIAEGPPKYVFEHLGKYAALSQGEWNTRDQFECRYEFAPPVGMTAFHYHESSAGIGFLWGNKTVEGDFYHHVFKVSKHGLLPISVELPKGLAKLFANENKEVRR